MPPEDASADGQPEEELKEGVRAELAEFPMNAGIARAMAAFALVYVGTTVLIAVGGFAEGTKVFGIMQLIGLVMYSAHNIQFVVGDPGSLWFLSDTTWQFGNVLQGQSRTGTADVPLALYYLLPVAVLFGTGAEFAYSHWDVEDWPHWLESVKFATAVAVPYVLLLLLFMPTLGRGTNLGNVVGPGAVTTGLFGLAYPAFLVMFGSLAVYVYRKFLA